MMPMYRPNATLALFAALLLVGLTGSLVGQDNPTTLNKFRAAAMKSGDAARGKIVFASKEAGCTKCHQISGDKRLAGPDLLVIGDKYSREQLIRAMLQPSATIHPDYGAVVVNTKDGKVHTGVLYNRTDKKLQLLDAEGKIVQIPVGAIGEEKRSKTSLMPTGLEKSLKIEQFADLTVYLTTLKQKVDNAEGHRGLVAEIPKTKKQVRLVPLHAEEMRFDHPVWIIAMPGTKDEFLVVEQQTRKVWRFKEGKDKNHKTLFADLSDEASTGEFEGVMCLAFHPQFLKNRKYYLNYHVREKNRFTPMIVERQATADLSRDAGGPSRRLLEIHQDTDLHWGGMLAFGPDNYLYIGAGDGGPQEDPDGHSQDLSVLLGSILRIDVDRKTEERAYGIPATNPYRDGGGGARPEIWASGLRMPWRFSFDPATDDLWVGDIGQNLFENVRIVRLGENHGWNVYEGFTKFSDLYRRRDVEYTPPVVSYRRKHGVSVTGGYVYRGKKTPSFNGVYVFGDFESKRIFALTQKNRKLTKIRQIGTSPERISSFGVDADGELFVVGYKGTIYRLLLDGVVFE
jgi:putative heme-binding domain-containing protein